MLYMTYDNRQAGTDEIKVTEEMIQDGARVLERYLDGSWAFTYAPEIVGELFTIMLCKGASNLRETRR